MDRTHVAMSVTRQVRAELHSEFNASFDRTVDKVSCSLLARLDDAKNDVDTVIRELLHVSMRTGAFEKDVDEKHDML